MLTLGTFYQRAWSGLWWSLPKRKRKRSSQEEAVCHLISGRHLPLPSTWQLQFTSPPTWQPNWQPTWQLWPSWPRKFRVRPGSDRTSSFAKLWPSTQRCWDSHESDVWLAAMPKQPRITAASLPTTSSMAPQSEWVWITGDLHTLH